MEIKLKENELLLLFFIEKVEKLIIFFNKIWYLDMPWRIRIGTNNFCINYTCHSEMLDYGFNKFDLI